MVGRENVCICSEHRLHREFGALFLSSGVAGYRPAWVHCLYWHTGFRDLVRLAIEAACDRHLSCDDGSAFSDRFRYPVFLDRSAA